ncbi:unnamed protein product [Candidula unifasciata]|uniref:Uncharacterized protein n=1 Tax=Candidula unifasciata TaxID=100452 RepID=A0A8S3YC78_9EUPU|nr:unnamed protein product [Candidula unifasciata]
MDIDDDQSVGRNDTDRVDSILVPWLSSNNSYDPSIYNFGDGSQNFSIPAVGGEDDAADLPVLLSVRLAIIVAVISSIIILAWASLALHRKRIRDSKKRKRRKDTLL